jgi:cell wall-associated NlpC family hydrolase
MVKHAQNPVHSHYNKMKLMIPLVAAGTLLCSTAVAAQADTGQNNLPASSIAQQNAGSFERVSEVVEIAETAAVTSSATATLSFERPVVKTTPAPPKPVEKPVVKLSQETPTPAPAAKPAAVPVAAAARAATPAVAGAVTDPANIPAAPGVATGAADSFGAAIAAAALAQLNREQDCTMLVTNSLKAVGINFHGWPAGYLSLGTVTTNPQPGDLIYYKNGGSGMAHIAVYIGNYGGRSGMAVHGGWDGHTTKVFSANVGSGPIYIHVNR